VLKESQEIQDRQGLRDLKDHKALRVEKEKKVNLEKQDLKVPKDPRGQLAQQVHRVLKVRKE
jgi:hypothetical protein